MRFFRKHNHKPTRRQRQSAHTVAAEIQPLESRQLLSAVNGVEATMANEADDLGSLQDFLGETDAKFYRGADQIYWDAVPEAADYEFVVYNKDAGTEVLRAKVSQYSPDTIIDETRGVSIPLSYSAEGIFQIFVRPIHSDGSVGNWGQPTEVYAQETGPNWTLEIRSARVESGSFENGIDLGERPSVRNVFAGGGLVSTRIAGSATPTVSWSATTGAHHYEIEVYDVDTGQMVQQHGRTEQSMSLLPLADGNFQIFVRAVTANGESGTWSAPLELSVNTSTTNSLIALEAPSLSISDAAISRTPTADEIEASILGMWSDRGYHSVNADDSILQV